MMFLLEEMKRKKNRRVMMNGLTFTRMIMLKVKTQMMMKAKLNFELAKNLFHKLSVERQ